MSSPQRPGGPRDERGPLAWATAVNDDTQEWVAAISRVLSAVWALVTAILLLFVAAQPSWNAAAMAALTAAYAGATGWLGFVRLANPDWKGAPDDGDAD